MDIILDYHKKLLFVNYLNVDIDVGNIIKCLLFNLCYKKFNLPSIDIIEQHINQSYYVNKEGVKFNILQCYFLTDEDNSCYLLNMNCIHKICVWSYSINKICYTVSIKGYKMISCIPHYTFSKYLDTEKTNVILWY